jgi:CspA family cold shock protein
MAMIGTPAVRELQELIAAIDRRIPQQARLEETAIANDAALLKARALARIAELKAGPPLAESPQHHRPRVFETCGRSHSTATSSQLTKDNTMAHLTGTIKRLVSDKGFGFILASDGNEYFFHNSACSDTRFDDLREGQEVTFDRGQGPKGPRGENVRTSS